MTIESADSTNDSEDRVLDRVVWNHQGLRCKVLKMSMGHYCGYVRSMFDTRLAYDDFQDYRNNLISVNSGLSYGPDEDGWLGFDCAHSWDFCINEDGEPWGSIVLRDEPREDDRVWSLADVQQETEELAEKVDVIQEFVGVILRVYGDYNE